MSLKDFEKVDETRFIIRKRENMRVDGIIYASEILLPDITRDNAHIQVMNVATLPGVIRASMAMPDIHWGYGFPIGGVAAMDLEEGVISPGGVGYDINCGVRLLRTGLHISEISNRIEKIIHSLSRAISTGVGGKGPFRLSISELKDVLALGAKWAVSKGYGRQSDLEYIEENGCMKNADPDVISSRALERGSPQLGTLGSGNHFIELQVVEDIYWDEAARVFNLKQGDITLMIHTGSRGLGYQVCADYIDIFMRKLSSFGFDLPDKQLVCAPVKSREGQDYLAAMAASANYAWANRQIIMHMIEMDMMKSCPDLKPHFSLLYDVAHNIAKIEEHIIDSRSGKKKRVCVHRKGATRAFGPGELDVPEQYRKIGQPVIIPGDMGRSSYLLAGTKKAMEETFGSTCHGAGRVMSRNEAIRSLDRKKIEENLKNRGIVYRVKDKHGLLEESSEAYKNVDLVVDVVDRAGLSKRVARLRPLGVVKG